MARRDDSKPRWMGRSPEAVADRVLEEGLVPDCYKRRFRGASRKSMVEKIVKNPFYRGDFLWGDELYPGKHEAVVTAKEWAQAQEVGRMPQRGTRPGKGDLSDWIRCEDCGCKVIYEEKRKPSGRVYRYYHCTNGRRQHDRQKNVREEVILEGFEPALDAISVSEEMAEQIADALNETHHKVRAARKREAAKHQRALDDLEGQEDQLFDLFRAGTLDERGYKRQLERVRAERRRFSELLDQAHEELDDAYLVTAQRVLELATRAKTLWRSRTPKEKRVLLERLLQNPRLEGTSVRYDLRKPFEVLSLMRERVNWRGRRDSNSRPPA